MSLCLPWPTDQSQRFANMFSLAGFPQKAVVPQAAPCTMQAPHWHSLFTRGPGPGLAEDVSVSTATAMLTFKLLEGLCMANEGMWPWDPVLGLRGCSPGTRCAPPDGTDHQALPLPTQLQGGVVRLTTAHSVCHCPKRECCSLPAEVTC